MNKIKFVYTRPKGLTKRDVFIALLHFAGKKMQYSGNFITTEEELDIELAHYQFLKKYNLLWNLN